MEQKRGIGPGRFLWLDFLRGWAALSVIAFHVKNGPERIFGSNGLWVDFFFILSGFVLYPKLKFATSRIDFARARFLRLFPIALIALALSLLFETLSYLDEKFSHQQGLTRAFGSSRPLWSFFVAVALLQVFIPFSMNWVGALWSLSAEWWSNILTSSFKSATSTFRTSLLLLGGFVAASYQFISPSDRGVWFGISLLGRSLVGFSIGIILRSRFKNVGERETGTLFILAFVAVPVLIWAAWTLSGFTGWLVAEALFPLLIWSGANLRNPKPNSLMQLAGTKLGILSFGIYAYQQGVYELLTLVLKKLNAEVNWECTFAILVLGSVSLAHLSNRYLEPRLATLFEGLVRVRLKRDTH